VKPPPFEYHDPGTLAEALELLATTENARLLAGGQSLMPMLNMRYVRPDHVIDINLVPELAYIRDEESGMRIGAMTRQRALEYSPEVRRRAPLMREALLMVGHRQTRNRGTIGGSLCHLDPAAELPCVATAYDAVVDIASSRGRRDIPMATFPAFYMTPAIEPDEMVTGLRFDHWPDGHGSAFLEFARRHGDFAIVSLAVLLDVAPGGAIRRASVTVGGASHAPQRVTKAEKLLVGQAASEEVLPALAAACTEIEAMGDAHASADYRRHLAMTLGRRAAALAYARARHGVGGKNL